jgi:hypothetical protein
VFLNLPAAARIGVTHTRLRAGRDRKRRDCKDEPGPKRGSHHVASLPRRYRGHAVEIVLAKLAFAV